MIKITDDNINTGEYWDSIYQGYENRSKYEEETKGLADQYLRFEQALKYVEPNYKVLDIGCGTGLFTRMCNAKGAKAWGVDISPKVIEENIAVNDGCNYFVHEVGKSDITRLCMSFDVVFSGETLEHLTNPADLFTDAYKVLKENGLFIVTTPINNAIQSKEHVYSFSQRDLYMLYEDAGFIDMEFVELPEPDKYFIHFAYGVKP